ncbi:Glyoxalase-like domain protein [Arthrobacter saudimassiliensis]|uniref:Glyoxalase-like domain protein n=1 Tax=Arthrobacter saudimassiliensis TaxID=1461584 RepID=A0A078MRC1_9MICC|nr:Glyoxalase-like domain protein [Arthrobacter saudimassiliensis]
MIYSWHTLVIDCPDADALASFYQELLDLPRLLTEPDWVAIGGDVQRPSLSFQQVEDYRAPEWPGQGIPQQMHLDVHVRNLDHAEKEVLARGARRLPGGAEDFRVYADPAGHPFCLVQQAQEPGEWAGP